MSYTAVIGADPEVFISNKADPDKIVSCHEIIPGTKTKPHVVDDEGQSIQVDGLAAEYNIAPCSTPDEFVFRNSYMLNVLKETIKDEHQLRTDVPFYRFTRKYIEELPPEIRRIGCAPDFGAYGGNLNHTTRAAEPANRGTGGHIHVGWTKNQDNTTQHVRAGRQVALQVNTFLYPVLRRIESSLKNRMAYRNRNGTLTFDAFRPTKYGMELRTPSNVWIRSERLMYVVFELTALAFDLLANKQKFVPYHGEWNRRGTIESTQVGCIDATFQRMRAHYPLSIQKEIEEIIKELKKQEG